MREISTECLRATPAGRPAYRRRGCRRRSSGQHGTRSGRGHRRRRPVGAHRRARDPRSGWEPVLLEASDRVGGRILTAEPITGVPVELGAQWIGDTHHRMQGLAADLGVAIFDQFEEGETSYEFAGDLLRGSAFHAKYGHELAEWNGSCEIDRMAETVPVQAPWLAPEADAWDRVTVGAWYDSQDSPRSPARCWRSAPWGSFRCPPWRCPCSICCSTCRCAG